MLGEAIKENKKLATKLFRQEAEARKQHERDGETVQKKGDAERYAEQSVKMAQAAIAFSDMNPNVAGNVNVGALEEIITSVLGAIHKTPGIRAMSDITPKAVVNILTTRNPASTSVISSTEFMSQFALALASVHKLNQSVELSGEIAKVESRYYDAEGLKAAANYRAQSTLLAALRHKLEADLVALEAYAKDEKDSAGGAYTFSQTFTSLGGAHVASGYLVLTAGDGTPLSGNGTISMNNDQSLTHPSAYWVSKSGGQVHSPRAFHSEASLQFSWLQAGNEIRLTDMKTKVTDNRPKELDLSDPLAALGKNFSHLDKWGKTKLRLRDTNIVFQRK